MGRNRSGIAGLALLIGLASGCQSLPEPVETVETPVADLMYELLQGEMSGFRGDLPGAFDLYSHCLLYTSPSPRDRTRSRMPSSA